MTETQVRKMYCFIARPHKDHSIRQGDVLFVCEGRTAPAPPGAGNPFDLYSVTTPNERSADLGGTALPIVDAGFPPAASAVVPDATPASGTASSQAAAEALDAAYGRVIAAARAWAEWRRERLRITEAQARPFNSSPSVTLDLPSPQGSGTGSTHGSLLPVPANPVVDAARAFLDNPAVGLGGLLIEIRLRTVLVRAYGHIERLIEAVDAGATVAS